MCWYQIEKIITFKIPAIFTVTIFAVYLKKIKVIPKLVDPRAVVDYWDLSEVDLLSYDSSRNLPLGMFFLLR